MKKNRITAPPSFIEFITGIGMTVAGLIILLMNIHVVSFDFYRFGRVSSGPVLVVVFVFLLILAVARSKALYWLLVTADVFCIIVSVILGTELYFSRISVFTLLVMLALFAAGVGLILKNLAIVRQEVPGEDK